MTLCLQVLYEDIKLIHGYDKNARTHDEKQIRQIAVSIERFGLNNPLLVDESGEIIAGHGRFEAAKLLGLTEVPCIRLLHLSDAQKRAYRLADNKIALNSGWTEDLLRLEIFELEAICEESFDITDTGFSMAEIDVLLDDQSKKPDSKLNATPFIPENEIVTKLGDVWSLGPHRIICGNSLEEETFKNLMLGSVCAMCLQDGPFNVSVNGHVGGSGAIKHAEFAFASGEMTAKEFIDFLIKNFGLCKKYSKDGSLHYNFMDWRHMTEILEAGKVFDSLVNLCIWNKGIGGMGSLYRSQHEMCFIFKNGKDSHTNNVQLGSNGRYRTNVWDYPPAGKTGQNADLRMHPTVKPVEMLKDAILDVTKRGDIVLDTFLGSGSTLIAAEKAKRVCYGIEYEPKYVDTAIRRYQGLFGKQAVLEATGETYDALLEKKRQENTTNTIENKEQNHGR